MKKVYKYGYFRGMNPVCPRRIEQYPDLEPIAAAGEEVKGFDPVDLEDAQHQWAYRGGLQILQPCFEEGCNAIRPVPLDEYPESDKAFILRQFIATSDA